MLVDTVAGGASVGEVGVGGKIERRTPSMRQVADEFIAKAPGGPESWVVEDLCEKKGHALLRHYFTRHRGQTSKGLRDALGRFCEEWDRPSGKYSISIVMIDRSTGTMTSLPCVKGAH